MTLVHWYLTSFFSFYFEREREMRMNKAFKAHPPNGQPCVPATLVVTMRPVLVIVSHLLSFITL